MKERRKEMKIEFGGIPSHHMGFWQSWKGILGHSASVSYLTTRKDIDSTPHNNITTLFFFFNFFCHLLLLKVDKRLPEKFSHHHIDNFKVQ